MNAVQRGISLLVVEDHRAIAAALAGLLADEPDITLMGVATDVATAATMLQTERPAVALCDIMLDGLEAGFDLLQRFGGGDGTAFVMFSAYGFPSYYARAVEGGAAGYVLKTASMEDILAEVRRAASGRKVPLAETVRRARSAAPSPTARELEIIRLVVDGRQNKEVAAMLAVSVKTIESRLRLLFDRYDLQNRTELAALAHREGWLPRNSGGRGFSS